eukprot:GGOE01021943.1.p1 GENE.GGOE01021943.1~~GGOE01021943.1.p1  ORF type:complete len:390 (+),score=90.01 GGOE01021943.1:112-1281(+)
MAKKGFRRRMLASLSDADVLDHSLPAPQNPPSLFPALNADFDLYRSPPRYNVTYVKEGLRLPVNVEKRCCCGSPHRMHDMQPCCVGPPPAGLLVTSSWDASIKLWNVARGRCLATGTGHTGPLYCSALAAPNCLVTGSGDRTLKLWDLSQLENPFTLQKNYYPLPCLRTLSGHAWPVNCVCICARMIVSGSGDRTLKVWSPKGKCRGTLAGHESSVDCCAVVSANPGVLASGSFDQSIRLWDLQTGGVVASLHTNGAVNCVHVLPDGRVASGAAGEDIQLWDHRQPGICTTLLGHKAAVTALTSGGGMDLLSGSVDASARAWDLRTGETLTSFDGHAGQIQTLAMFGEQHCISGSSDSTLKVWDLQSGHCCITLTGHTGNVTGAHPAGQ